MFTFVVQLFDLIYLHQIGLFFAFFVISWAVHLTKLYHSREWGRIRRIKTIKEGDHLNVSILIPVVDEPMEVWRKVLFSVKQEMAVLKRYVEEVRLATIDIEVIVLPNGSNAVKESALAKDMGFKVVRVSEAGKRNALYEGAKHCKSDAIHSITIILDSDTVILDQSSIPLIEVFMNSNVGGATPRHFIDKEDSNIWRKVSSWLEDIRFNEVLAGQDKKSAISCLPGRLLAVRTHLFKECVVSMHKQTFLGAKCISGDDRYLTSWLLERYWKCIYVPESHVCTEAPDTFKGFVKQRLRWSRTSLRETIRSLPWIFRYPYTAFTVLTNVLTRWLFFAVVVNFILFLFGITKQSHYFDLSVFMVVVGSVLGFLMSGTLRQIRHLRQNPSDVKYLIPFLLVTTFVLTPIEWFGNLTLRESGWMTRKLED